jgi:type II secretory pathway pseudopilin PulG
MYLQGQPGRRGDHGYAMATLLVALAVMAVLMSAALPAWRHQAKREKEAELAFRGEQYVRAIQLWERKMGPGSRPPSFDILVQQKYLRKKYTDPMSADGEFQPLFAGLNQAPGGGRGRGAAPTPPAGRGNPAGALAGGIIGVRSTSTEASIRIYKGATRYNEWQFIHAGAATTPGGRGGSPVPGGRGVQPMPGGPGRGRGTGPDGRGIGPGGRGFGPGIPGLPGRGRGQ